jgi:hypothetical protein
MRIGSTGRGDCYTAPTDSQRNKIVWIKVVIVLVFLGILISLGSGLFYLVKDHGDSRRTVKALTFRVGLSVGLFAFSCCWSRSV